MDTSWRRVHLPNIGVRILLQPLQSRDDFLLNDLLPSSIVLQHRCQDFERLRDVESNVGDLVVA
jgi:hypothetical protein